MYKKFILKDIPSGKQIQLIAIVEEASGSLLFTDGTPQGSYGINASMPREQRVMSANLGRIVFGGIWGETEQEARQTLGRLRQNRIKLN